MEILIKKIKKDESYSLDKNISILDVFAIVFVRFLMLSRGWVIYSKTNWKSFPFFVGKRVTIRFKRKLKCGAGCTIGDGVSIEALSKKGITIGNGVSIPAGTFIRCTGVYQDLGEGLSIGDNTGLGHYNFINAQGGVFIGNDVIIGPYVKILSENHNFQDGEKLIRNQGVNRKGINIGNNVWIGAGVTILDGVNISDGAVIAAGAVVNSDVEKDTVVAGIPARKIKNRIVNIK